MAGSAVYGLILGGAFVLFCRAAPQPGGSLVWWTFWAVHLTWAAGVCWRRTGLPYATAAMTLGALTSAAVALLAASRHVFPDLPAGAWVPVGAALLSGPLLLFLESRVHPAEWRQWRDYMEEKNAWDIFTGRHIPRLRQGGPPTDG